jgi:DNA invertase Pin-like site-specific DNA recombinase
MLFFEKNRQSQKKLYIRCPKLKKIFLPDRKLRSAQIYLCTIYLKSCGANALGKGLRSLTESMDTTTSGGRLIFHIFASLAEFERCIIRERTMAGLAAAKRLGRRGGRPRSLNSDDLLVARALLKDENITVEDVARRLSVAPSTLYLYFPGGRSMIQ